MKNGSIKVDYLARVEGEGAFYVKVADGKVVESQLRIFEPPRFFEGFLKGRRHEEVVDITARICGICPIAYQSASSQAMERIMGIKVDGQLRELRRLMYCGEWIESHALHVFMLHAPDFLGYQSVIHMAPDFPDIVKQALGLKKLGNDIMVLLGGREIHPVGWKVGGFHKVPDASALKPFVPRLEEAIETCLALTTTLAKVLKFPKFDRKYEFVSLDHPTEYPILDGRIKSSNGLNIDASEYEANFKEEHVERANALQGRRTNGDPYFVGPLARFNNSFEKLSVGAKKAAKIAGVGPGVSNPFKGILVRMVETVWALEEAIKIINAYKKPEAASVEYTVKAGRGMAISEAPRGMIYHRYTVGEKGLVVDAKITPPTAQNQPTIEEDLRQFVEANLDLPEDKLTWECEKAIRNYDPCISCATHFLKLKVDRV
jgi:coenzyme F420-reducing hydrogenase alpha subunit